MPPGVQTGFFPPPGPWAGRTAPRPQLGGAGAELRGHFRVCLETAVGGPALGWAGGYGSFLVPGWAGLLPGCSLKGLKSGHRPTLSTNVSRPVT